MEAGFITNVVGFNDVGTYPRGNLANSLNGTISPATPLVDYASNTQIAPWYATDRAAFFDYGAPGAQSDQADIQSNDSPENGAPLFFDMNHNQPLGTGLLKSIALTEVFQLNICVATVDTQNNADTVYTRRETTTWTFNGSGPINQNTDAWTPAGGVFQIAAPPGWQPVKDGSVPVSSGTSFNAALGRENFHQ